MKKRLSPSESYRYERKYVVSELTLQEVDSLVRFHPMIFLEIYHQRFINNIYFDSFDMKHYFDTVIGSNDRLKVRVRWYGDLFGNIEKPILEFKIKKGLLVKKESFPVKGFSIDKNLKLDAVANLFRQSAIPGVLKLHLGSLRAVFLNRYRRKYFLSADRNYRITLDSEMEWYRLDRAHNNLLHRTVDFSNVVLELKYSPQSDELVNKVIDCFPFRAERNSKYVNGIERLSF